MNRAKRREVEEVEEVEMGPFTKVNGNSMKEIVKKQKMGEIAKIEDIQEIGGSPEFQNSTTNYPEL